MDWKLILGDAYTEGMTDDECQKIFNELFILKTQHDLDLQKMKTSTDNLSKENADWKRKYREKQSEEERKSEELAEQQILKDKEYSDLKRDLNIIKTAKQYMGMGYDENLATETATAFIDGDQDTVFSNQKLFSENLRKSIKSELMKDMPNPPSGNKVDIDYSKQIEEARDNGDMVAMAALIRSQTEANLKNEK